MEEKRMKCEKCNVEMIDGSLYGKPRFIDIDHDIDKFYVSIKTGKKTSVLGLEVDETKKRQSMSKMRQSRNVCKSKRHQRIKKFLWVDNHLLFSL